VNKFEKVKTVFFIEDMVMGVQTTLNKLIAPLIEKFVVILRIYAVDDSYMFVNMDS